MTEPLTNAVPEQTPECGNDAVLPHKEDLEPVKTAVVADTHTVKDAVGAMPPSSEQSPAVADAAASAAEQAPAAVDTTAPASEQATALALGEPPTAADEAAAAPAPPAEQQQQQEQEPAAATLAKSEKRKDPATGRVLTYDAYLKQYKDRYSGGELETYWAQTCMPLNGSSQGKGGSGAQRRGKPKRKA
jgi:hypothetical protein